jgi:uncharacterized membrane protein (UPF0127 family)
MSFLHTSENAESTGSSEDDWPAVDGPDSPGAHRSRMRKLVLIGPRGQVVCGTCHVANRPHTRMRGVIGWRRLGRGEGVLLQPCSSVHTAFVRFPIDAVFLDDEMKVVSVRSELKPWRLAWKRGARAVLELASGECDRLGVRPGDRLGWGSA